MGEPRLEFYFSRDVDRPFRVSHRASWQQALLHDVGVVDDVLVDIGSCLCIEVVVVVEGDAEEGEAK
jgi:hypothetical protein